MKKSCIVLFAAAILSAAPPCDPLPPGFADRAYKHTLAIVSRSPRPASSDGERKTIDYIRDGFLKIGLRTAVEEFAFESYEIEKMELRTGGGVFRPVSVAFNPYSGVSRFEGVAELVDPGEPLRSPDLQDLLVVTAPPAGFFALMARGPKLIVFLAPADFATMKAAGARRFELEIAGRPVTYRSANVVADVAPRRGASRDIVVGAHLDASGRSPGASDNASGTGVLIELARHFQRRAERLGARIRFVAFGAEEVGLAGSRAYVLKHGAELPRCALHVNLDDLGGPRCPIVETEGGVTNLPERAGTNLLPADLMRRAWEGPKGDWRLMDPRLFRALQASNHPVWIGEAFERAARGAGVKLVQTQMLGSDQLIFTQAGVPATGIGCPGETGHTADTLEKVRKPNFRVAGTLAACLVEAAANPGSETRIRRSVEDIAAGADNGARRAAVLRALDAMSAGYRLEKFCSGSQCGVNVLVEPMPARRGTILLGAHYDRVAKGAGAVDNAAGVTAVLELLQAFRRKPPANFAIGAAFFDLEEAGLLGSKDYVSARTKSGLPALYLNFDVLAYGDAIWMTSGDETSAAAFRTAARKQGVALEDGDSPPGDDRPFRAANVKTLGFALVPKVELEPIRRILRGEEASLKPSLLNIMHTENDRPDKVNAGDVARAVAVVERAIRTLDTGR